MMTPIYLDYMATTPVDPRVIEVLVSYLGPGGTFGNAASATHFFGVQAKQCVEQARAQVAQLIHADPKEIIWTSGATEADNLAIKGACDFYQRKGRHIITMQTEHKAVLDTCAYLSSQGYEVTYLKPTVDGLVDLQALEDSIRADTILVSIMYVNNETGVIQDFVKIAEIVKSKGVLLHTDATQAAGKITIDVTQLPVDLLSLSAHKLYGPKGIGALYMRSKPALHLTPLIHGGQHERGMRSGTLATHQIVGMGKAFELAQQEMAQDAKKALSLTKQLLKGFSALGATPSVQTAACVPHCLNMIVPKIRSEALMLATPELAYSSGSACNSATLKPSHVLSAMGMSPELADCAIRVSVGRFTEAAEITAAIDVFARSIARLNAVVGSFA